MSLKIGDYLRIARENANLRQVDVMEKTKLNNHNLSNWEKGKSEPCVADAIILADLYGVTLDELFGHRPSSVHNIALTNMEKRFILKLRKLNNEGLLKVIEYVDDLEGNSKYNEKEKVISVS